MKVIVDASSLAKELKKVSPVMMKNTILPILEGVRMETVGNTCVHNPELPFKNG